MYTSLDCDNKPQQRHTMQEKCMLNGKRYGGAYVHINFSFFFLASEHIHKNGIRA